MRAAIYTRISKDPTGEGAGVARQEEDCRAKAATLGWTVVDVHTDNDTSAYTAKRRPGYRALLDSIEAGHVDAVIVWHADRLYRRIADLEEYIDVCSRHDVPTHTVRSGDLDLSTPSGRTIARILGAVARGESEQKADRQRRANRQRALQGKHAGTRRCFGYEMDGVTIREPEAAAIRQAYDDLLAGRPLARIADDWNSRGLYTPQAGNRWASSVVRLTMETARLAGMKTYRGEVVRDATGEPIKAEWPAIVDLDTWHAVQALLHDPARRATPAGPRSLLSGIALCGVCGAPMMSGGTRNGRRRIRCSASAGHPYRENDPIEAHVVELVLERLSRPDAAELLAPAAPAVDVAGLRAELAGIEQRRSAIAEAFADGAVTIAQLTAATARLDALAAEVEDRMPRPTHRGVARLVRAGDPRAVWAALDHDERRAVIGAVVTVRVLPARTKERAYLDWRARVVNPASVGVVWEPTPPRGVGGGRPRKSVA